jgi:hypothetical protein
MMAGAGQPNGGGLNVPSEGVVGRGQAVAVVVVDDSQPVGAQP